MAWGRGQSGGSDGRTEKGLRGIPQVGAIFSILVMIAVTGVYALVKTHYTL